MLNSQAYLEFLQAKVQDGAREGFAPVWMPDFLFDFQQSLVDWAVRLGRDAIFADCGLGKTPMQLVWAENVVRKTNRSVLIITPLAVAPQTIAEASKFGVPAQRAEALAHGAMVRVTNYEQLHHNDPSEFAGVVCDESSILKSFDGKRQSQITEFMRRVPYRLLCTATAAPNDYIELGTSSEALGYLGYTDMLTRFFKKPAQSFQTTREKWHLKGHAAEPFWRWVCSWARAVRKPSDLGFADGRFILPPLREETVIVKAHQPRDGQLFDLDAVSFHDERELTRRTIAERCEAVAERVSRHDVSLVWCHLNDEGDLLARLIPDSVQVSGADSDAHKEAAVDWFVNGTGRRCLISKPRIFGFGLNFQHCNHVAYFPTHSYEQYYQAVRRCWRFGQSRPVQVDLIGTDGDARVIANLQRKAEAANRMFADLVAHMNEALHVSPARSELAGLEIPQWL